jgi:hypothetical protein
MIANVSGDLLGMRKKYMELDKKFKLYYIKSDKYIKDRESKVDSLRKECEEIA